MSLVKIEHFQTSKREKTGPRPRAKPRSTFNATVNCLHPDNAPPSDGKRAEACGLLPQWKKDVEPRK